MKAKLPAMNTNQKKAMEDEIKRQMAEYDEKNTFCICVRELYSRYYEIATVVENNFIFWRYKSMKKNDEMIKRVATEFGNKTPQFTKLALDDARWAIGFYEEAGPIDILGEGNANDKQVLAFGRLIQSLAAVSVFLDALMEWYDIDWKTVEARIKEPSFYKTLRKLED